MDPNLPDDCQNRRDAPWMEEDAPECPECDSTDLEDNSDDACTDIRCLECGWQRYDEAFDDDEDDWECLD